ncbi:MAG: membrane dipeptidase [Chloroflexi bacterium RBG_16_69_14]|nr:MAG: membrane dipeptidase [Chloroflexi bacterium RBG_16_69_14]
MTTTKDPFLERARATLAEAPLIDGHNDLPIALREKVGLRISEIDLRRPVAGLHTDLPRLRVGCVGGQFWSVWVPADLPEERALPMALEQLDIVHRLAGAYPETLELATTAEEVERTFAAGRIASLIGLEGGSMIGSSLPILRMFHARGVRYMTLTHWRTTRWADAATDEPRHGGLTRFGIEVVREMNRLGMLVDLSHVAPSTMAAALDAAEAPVVYSHSGARAITDHPRNVPDDILRRIPANGGVVMAVFLSNFVSDAVNRHMQPGIALEQTYEREHPEASAEEIRRLRHAWLAEHPGPDATLGQVADHIDHLCSVAGVEHVGIGSDFDGGETLPVGLEDVSCFPALIAELLRRGYTESDVRLIAGGNVLRVMREAEAAAVRLQAARPPSEATIEELDGP